MKWQVISCSSLGDVPEGGWEPFAAHASTVYYRRQVPEKEEPQTTPWGAVIVNQVRSDTLKEVSVWLENPCVYTSHRYNCPGCVQALIKNLKEGRMP